MDYLVGKNTFLIEGQNLGAVSRSIYLKVFHSLRILMTKHQIE